MNTINYRSIIWSMLFLLITLTSCKSVNNPHDMVMITGRVTYNPDNTPLMGVVIQRASDGKTYYTDDNGVFYSKVIKGDSLRFSFVGTVGKTIPVMANDTSLEVKLDPYILGPDEYVVKIESDYPEMETHLKTYIADKKARIGIAVVIEDKDTVSVNGRCDFPMMSVFKFPLALAVAKWVDDRGMSLEDSISFDSKLLNENTYSPMLKKYGKGVTNMSIRELLEWSLIDSDNNAADILLKSIGGTECATDLLKEVAGPLDIAVGATEDDMYNDPGSSRLNRSTPLAMASLFNLFDSGIRNRSESFKDIALMLERCRTGVDRLAAPLINTDAVIGHKTGTGFSTPAGGITALNDCGYVHLPNGRRYSIAVFIADSDYDIGTTSKMIADISKIVFNSF